MSKENIHSGHRERMRASFVKRDFETMPEHEILEILLYYGHPRNNTNELAHKLIKKFGNLKNVLSASYEELIKVEGVGENTAVLLIMFSRLSLRYAACIDEEKEPVDNNTLAKRLIVNFKLEAKEQVKAVMFDKKGVYSNISDIVDGDVDDATFRTRDLIKAAMRSNASKMILVHNHPQGFAIPSYDDVETTRKVKNVLWSVDIELLDHWIISGNECFSMKNNEKYADIF